MLCSSDQICILYHFNTIMTMSIQLNISKSDSIHNIVHTGDYSVQVELLVLNHVVEEPFNTACGLLWHFCCT